MNGLMKYGVTISLAASALVAGACGESVEPTRNGTLELQWEVKPHGCDGADIDHIEAELSYDAGERTERFECDAGEGEVDNLEPANYRVRLIGRDIEGDPTFGTDTVRVTVHGDERNETPPLRLTARPANVQVNWRFANGMVCGANHVDRVTVALYDGDDFEVARQKFSCSKGQGTVEDVPPGPYLIELDAPAGQSGTYSGSVQTKLKRGKTSPVEVVLEQDASPK